MPYKQMLCSIMNEEKATRAHQSSAPNLNFPTARVRQRNATATAPRTVRAIVMAHWVFSEHELADIVRMRQHTTFRS